MLKLQDVPTDSTVLSPGAVIRVETDQVSCELDDEAVILNLADGTYYGLNPLAARIWDLIQKPTGFTEICAIVESEYDVPSERCARDVTDLLLQLEAWALVKIDRSGLDTPRS